MANRVKYIVYIINSDLISTMTGGQAEIQNIQPYDNQFQDREDSGNYDLGLLETQRYDESFYLRFILFYV